MYYKVSMLKVVAVWEREFPNFNILFRPRCVVAKFSSRSLLKIFSSIPMLKVEALPRTL